MCLGQWLQDRNSDRLSNMDRTYCTTFLVTRVGRMVKIQKPTISAMIVSIAFVTHASNCITQFFRSTWSLVGKTLTSGQRTQPWWDHLSGATPIRVKLSSCIAETTVGCVAMFALASATSKNE